jgi:hypothetical protein
MRRDLAFPAVPVWHKDAACTDYEAELWFPLRSNEAWLATQICNNECPVRAECLQHAVDNDIKYGVWGGMTEQEREAAAEPTDEQGSPDVVNRARIKGTSWETVIVDYLRAAGWPHAERRALNGSKDRGDIAGLPGVVIEAKNCKIVELGPWIREAEAERHNDGAGVGVVWMKRRGKAAAEDGYVVMSGAQFVQLLREAGYHPEAS